MNYLWLTPEQLKQIIHHASHSSPHECCGLLVGKESRVIEVIEVENIAKDSQHFFYISPSDLATHLPRIAEQGRDLLGIYHSHPHGNPIPSAHDIQLSNYPNTVSLIIGMGTSSPTYAAWEIVNGRVDRVPIHVSTIAPEPADYSYDNSPSNAQNFTLILCTGLAVAIMLILAIALLPPAPPIP